MSLPPGPSAPVALQTLKWIRTPLRMLGDCQRRFGDVFTIRLPGNAEKVVMIGDPDVVKEVFAMGPDQGHAGKANIVLKPFLGEHSLLLLDGAEHLRQRKMMMPAFHGERMQAYGRSMYEIANASIDRWPEGRRFAVHEPMQQITLQVIVRTVFGIDAGARFRELASLLRRTLDASAWPGLLFPFMQHDFGRFSPWGRWKRLKQAASAILMDEIRGARRSNEERDDVLALMLRARDEKGEPLSDEEVHDELVTLLVAGHETTATALAWALRWIVPDPSLVRRLREEIASANGDPARIGKLELLDATVKESLRLQPVIPIVGRVLQEPMRIKSWDIPAGTLVAPSIGMVHRSPALYPQPMRFRPERFLEFKPSPWEWFPFGGGLRRCIGAAFAMYEMKMVLAAILARVDMRLATEHVRVVRRSITLTPSDGLPVITHRAA
ncbi:MAG TPA: cytochrome P450 [Labilithrix sp.]|jgi:cytochrome P450